MWTGKNAVEAIVGYNRSCERSTSCEVLRIRLDYGGYTPALVTGMPEYSSKSTSERMRTGQYRHVDTIPYSTVSMPRNTTDISYSAAVLS
jgi:hypothetical protein